MAVSLLKTKLYAPPLRPDMIRRQRLLQKLDDGITYSRCLTLVSAPAGYGKTTLVREWLNDIGRPFAWFSLDESDNDPTRFINYLVAALQTAAGTVGRAALSLLGLQNLPPVEGLVTTLINDIYSVSTPFILVIDDYHLIHRNYIHESMQYLLDHLPPSAHLIIITREDPPLVLPRFRVRGQLTEIRADDLRFTAEEAAVFFNQTMQLDINEEAISILGARTEGWAAGLQLAGLSLRGWHPERVNEFVKAFGGSHRYIIDYLVEEVLNQQDAECRIHAGKVQNSVKKFCQENLEQLLGKKVGIFLCTMTPAEEAYHYIEEQFPKELQQHAAVNSCFGGAVFFERMNFVERFIMKKITKSSENIYQVSEDAIGNFTGAFSEI